MAKQRRSIKEQEQKFLPGTAPKKNEAVHAAAVNYYDTMQERLTLTKAEKVAKDSLLATMADEGLKAYEYGGLKVVLQKKTSPKVTNGEKKPRGKKGKASDAAPEPA